MSSKEVLWKLLKKILRGKVTTYGALSRILKTSPRAVGAMLRSNPYAPKVPCHRVVKSDGSLGGYSGGIRRKKELLKMEGVVFNKKIDLKKYFCKPNI